MFLEFLEFKTNGLNNKKNNKYLSLNIKNYFNNNYVEYT